MPFACMVPLHARPPATAPVSPQALNKPCARRRRGEEVTHRYAWALERNDKALLTHFFVHGRQPPRLCGVDRPGGSAWADVEEEPDDEADYAPEGPLCTEVWPCRPPGMHASKCVVQGRRQLGQSTCALLRMQAEGSTISI